MLLKKSLKYFLIFLIAFSLTLVLARYYFRTELYHIVELIIHRVASDGIVTDASENKPQIILHPCAAIKQGGII